MGLGKTRSDESITSRRINLNWFQQLKDSGELKALFSPEFIEMLTQEINDITNDLTHSNLEVYEKLTSVHQKVLAHQTHTVETLENLENCLQGLTLNIQALVTENKTFSTLLADPNVFSTDAISAQSLKVENAKLAVNNSMKFASIFANEKDYETHRGTRYLTIKSQYAKLYPTYNAALMQANHSLNQALHIENEDKKAALIDQVLMILQTVLNDTNMRKVWTYLVATTSPADGSIVKIGGAYVPVPRGICNAWKELKNLKDDGSNKAEIVRKACLEMYKRLNKEGNDKKKPTNELYRVVSGFLDGVELAVSTEKVEDFKKLLAKPMFGLLEDMDRFFQGLQKVGLAR